MGEPTRLICFDGYHSFGKLKAWPSKTLLNMGMMPEIPELKDVLIGELKQHGRWLVASVNARMSRTLNVQNVEDSIGSAPAAKCCGTRQGLVPEHCR